MKPKIKSIDNIEIQNLEKWKPNDNEYFSIVFELLIGPSNSEGEEVFSIEICSFEWFKKNFKREPKKNEKGYLIVNDYKYYEIVNNLEKICNSIEEKDWNEISKQLSQYFNWEFDNYLEYKE